MPLPGSAFAAPPGVHGFDVNSVLNRRTCETAKARGFAFCIRYVSRQDAQPKEDLSETEASIILDAGLALMPVQHVAPENFTRKRWGPGTERMRPSMPSKSVFPRASTSGLISRVPRRRHRMRR